MRRHMTDSSQARIRLVLLAEPGLFRASLASLLASNPNLEVVRECANSGEAVKVLSGLPVDLVLIDFDLGAKLGVDFISSARESGYRGRFLILAGPAADVRDSTLILKLGTAGIFLKSEGPERLVEAIRIVAQGGSWVDDKVLHVIVDHLVQQRPMIERSLEQRLDSREQKVLTGIIGGLSNRRIASETGTSENFIKNVVQRLFRKAGVKSRSQLVRVALSGRSGPDGATDTLDSSRHRI